MPKKQPTSKKRASAFVTGLVAVIGITYLVYTKLPAHQRRNVREAISAKIGGLGQQGVQIKGDLDYGELPVFAGVPRDFDYGHKLKLIDNGSFAIGYCEERECAAWVAYRCFKIDDPITHERPSRFRIDERTAARVSHNDYTGSGFDRGHLAPNYVIDLCYGVEAQAKTFLMSNIIPQDPDLNQGVWKDLEQLVAKRYAPQCEELWVVCGPISDNDVQKLKCDVEIPDALYKIIVDEDGGSIRVLAFVMDQDVQRKEPLTKFLTSVDEIERSTRLDFLWELEDDAEDNLEATKPKRVW